MDAEAPKIVPELRRLLAHGEYRERMIASLRETAALLGGPGAHERAAEVVGEWLRGERKISVSAIAKQPALV